MVKCPNQKEIRVDSVLKNAKWFKSSKSGSAGHCVETAFLPDGGVAVRDSKDPAGPVLSYTREEWSAFTAGVRGGEFDLP